MTSNPLEKLEYELARSTAPKKVEVLQKHDSPLLRKILEISYNPYKRFGITLTTKQIRELIDQSNLAGEDISNVEVWNTLERFSSSTASSGVKYDYLKVLASSLSPTAVSQLCRIINKEAFSGVGQRTVDKAFKGLIPTFGVQLAAKYAKKKIKKFPVIVEPKYDGMRAIAICHKTGEVQVVTRTGREIPAAAYFHDELRTLAVSATAKLVARGWVGDGVIFDGEIVADTFNDSMSIYRAGSTATSGYFHVFDVLPLAAITDPAFSSDTQMARRVLLRESLEDVKLEKIKPSPGYLANSDEEIRAFYETFVAEGLEGVIVKTLDGQWERKRSNNWLKIKGEDTVDLQIIGAFEGEGEMVGMLGGIIVDFNGVEVRVGSGFKLKDRVAFWEMFLRDMLRAAKGEGDYELIGAIAELSYQEITPAKSLRHPVFHKVRLDKNEVSF